MSILLLCGFLISCGTDYEQLKVHFFAKRNLEVIETAVKGAKNPKFKKAIYSFCTEYGSQIYKEAFEKVARECLDPTSGNGLRHLDRLQTAIASGISLELPVSNASEYYQKCVTLRGYALRDFLSTQRSLGSEALFNKNFKKAVHHFTLYLEFQPLDADVQDLLAQSKKQAETHIVIKRFYTPSDTLGTAIRKEFAFLKKDHTDTLALQTVTRIEGLQINDLLYQSLIDYFTTHPQPFLIIHKENDSNIPSQSIAINGSLTSLVIDTENTPVRSIEKDNLHCLYEENGIQRWRYETFEYPVYTLTYSVSLNATIQTNDNQTWTINGGHTELRRYRTNEVFWVRPFNVIQIEYSNSYLGLSNALIPIDRSYACRLAIQDLASKLAEKIIEEFK